MSSIFAVLMGLIYLIFLGFGVFCLILSIKLMRRGIKALDKYLDGNL